MTRPLIALSLVFALVSCSQPAPPAPATNASSHDAHAPAAPAPRTALLGNLGSYHRAIKTTSPEAQQHFDEGLTLLYGFNHEESFKSFERAAALDPASPMPHWGMSLALGTNYNDTAPADRLKKAYTHLAEAEKRKANGSEVEQGLINALAKRYVADPSTDQAPREQAYSDAMGALAKQFKDDQDVATIYAESMMNLHPWKLHKPDGSPEPWTPPIIAALEGVLKANPQHPGANHYYIHAVEASKTPDRAVPAAGRLETLVPGAGHLVHMPAHIYIRTGQYVKSAKSNADAALVDEKYFKATGTNETFYGSMYYVHNLQFESAAAMFAGNLAEARSSGKRTVDIVGPIADQMLMLEPYAAHDLTVLLRFGKWDEVLSAKAPPASRTVQTAIHHYARGAAQAGLGKTAEAQAELEMLQQSTAKFPKEAVLGPTGNTAQALAALAALDLTGRIAQAKGDLTGAIKAFTDAVAAEDKLGYNEPPDWLLPERERLGVVLLAAGRAADAERVFRADLEKHVGNPRSLFGLWKSLEAQKKAAAGETKSAFEKAWVAADVTLGDDLYPARR